MSKVSKERGNVSTVEANIADDRIQKSVEVSVAAGAQGKHDDVSIVCLNLIKLMQLLT